MCYIRKLIGSTEVRVARRNSNLTSIGIPLGTLAIVAGCSGGGSVAPAPVASSIAGAPTLAPGQTMPVAMLINPPRRDAASRRLPASRKTKYQPSSTSSGVIKIGITAFAGSSTPVPAPTETVFTFPAVSGSSSPSPYPITVNVPVSGGDTFVVREYNGNTVGGSPNGYLLSTYTSATPIPVYLNATNRISITTQPVVSSVSFSPNNVIFWEDQNGPQTSAPVTVRLADVEGYQIDVPAANPVSLSATMPGLLGTAGSLPLPTSTKVPLYYPLQANASAAVSVSIPSLPNAYVAAPNPLTVTPDYYLFFGELGGGIDIFEAAPYFAGTQTAPAFSTSVPSPSPQLIGAQPGCGGYLAQALGTSNGFSYAFTVDLPATGPASTRTMNLIPSSSENGRALAPSSCSGYVLSSGGSGGYLYSIDMSSATAMNLTSVSAFFTPTGLAVDPLAATLYTGDSIGYLNSYNYSTSAQSVSSGPAGTPVGLVVGNGRIFQATSSGYLYGYTSATSTRATIGYLSATPVALTISNDGAKLFISQGNQIYFADNSTAMPTALSAPVTLPAGAAVTAMAVTPDNDTLLVASGSNNTLYKFALANIVTAGFPLPAVAAAIPANTQTFAISP